MCRHRRLGISVIELSPPRTVHEMKPTVLQRYPRLALASDACMERGWLVVPSPPARSWSSTPVFDAVVVGCEAVANAPQNRLGAAGDIDLAIDGSDVGLHRVRA